MNLNDLLRGKRIDPLNVLVLRHRPHEPELRRVLPWIAAEKPTLFNAYQQTQREKLERVMQAMTGSGYVASFIGHEPGKALFVGLYSIGKSKPITYEEYWKVPAYVQMKAYGMEGWSRASDRRKFHLWFDLEPSDFYPHWRGKLIVIWPPPERSWWRRAHRNEIPVAAIVEDSALERAMPDWNELALTWRDLAVLPKSWKSALSQWRAVYYIFDVSDGKGYVGAAYGDANLLGRWLNYAARGHGGNKLLRRCDPQHFKFSILERVSPDMDAATVMRLEASWKQRLHTRAPYGLNEN